MDKFNNMVGYFNKFHLRNINLTPSIFFLYYKPKKKEDDKK